MNSNKENHIISLIAGLLTLLVSGGIVVLLFVTGMHYQREALAENSTPEIELTQDEPEEEETFIEPLVSDAGDPDEIEKGEPAPQIKGEPEPAPKPSEKINIKDEGKKPAPMVEKPITQKQPSPVKVTTPQKNDKEESRITSNMKNAFSGRNGAEDGKPGASGSGGVGTANAKGNMKGRTMESCPKPDVALKNKVTIVVNVTVGEDGRVVSASASGSAEKYLRDACVAAARQSRWTPQKGVGTQNGTITFTITPKK